MIQSGQLIEEIDQISANTHFNNVKLLDGSNVDVKFQIGINASDTLKVDLESSDSISLGLSGAIGVTTLTSERIDEKDFSNTANSIAAADVKINGFNAFASDFNSDTSASGANEAKLLADAINANMAYMEQRLMHLTHFHLVLKVLFHNQQPLQLTATQLLLLHHTLI